MSPLNELITIIIGRTLLIGVAVIVVFLLISKK